jgi:Leucine rich repeat
MARDKAYRRAEKKIEDARRSGANQLDLRGEYGEKKLKLTELPESLSQLTQLQSLNLSRNELTVLPEWLSQLTRLQSLDLSNSQWQREHCGGVSPRPAARMGN